MEKENVFIDLSKCSDDQIKHIRQIDPLIDKIDIFPYLFWDETEWNQTHSKWITSENKTEITYQEFIKLFEGGDDNNGWIKIESEADLPKETIECRTCFYDGKNYVLGNTGERNSKQLWNAYKSIQITHYQPIVKPEPPKY